MLQENLAWNITEESRTAYLQLLQHRSNLSSIPALVFMAAVILCGLLGNSLIMFVYLRRKKKTSTAVFLQAIAIVDLVTNLAVIPVTIFVLFHVWDFPGPFMCKAHLFLNFSTSHAATTLLLGVAIVRYRKVCTPFAWQITTGQAKVICVVICVAACLVSITHAVVHGLDVIQTDRPGITGVMCRLDQKYVNTPWPKVVSATSLILFLSCWLPLTIMYARIGIFTWRHSRALEASAKIKTKANQLASGSSSEASGSCSNTNDADFDSCATPAFDTQSKEIDAPSNKDMFRSSFNKSIRISGKKMADRTTRMLIAVSVICIVTYLTTLILILMRFSASSRALFLHPVSESFYRLFLQSYIVNSAVNPFIYSWWDKSFRRDSLAYLKSCMPQCGRKSESQ
ncbi:hypothetical protein Btru_042704 [Bulinus truncatus]|nr:hypothetical protein Btru_042704 [Bulinus truncatus]